MNKPILFVLVILSCLYSCSKKVRINPGSAIQATVPFIIYKTKADYSQLVPVLLNPEKDKIVSYPAPTDLKNENGLLLPIALRDSFLFDQRGIGPNVAFTSYTYEQYSILEQAPSLTELENSLIDRDPLVTMYNCSACSEIRGDVRKMNRLVQTKFKKCVRLKPVSNN